MGRLEASLKLSELRLSFRIGFRIKARFSH